MSVDDQCMALALKAAEVALGLGEFPVGCVIVRGVDVVAVGARQGTADGGKRASELDHAEILALRSLESLGIDREDLALYCTMEPCLMCFAAIMLSGIKKVVFAYEDVMGGGTRCERGSLSPLYSDCGIKVIPGVMREKSLDLFYRFFNDPENVYWKGSLLEQYTLEQGKLSLDGAIQPTWQ